MTKKQKEGNTVNNFNRSHTQNVEQGCNKFANAGSPIQPNPSEAT
jgi:hypothetical protein